jgi:hypothetical protein
VPKFVAPSDAAAQWTGALRNAAFFAYADNYLIDIKFGIIMDVEASRAVLLRQAADLEAPGQVQRFGSDVPNSGAEADRCSLLLLPMRFFEVQNPIAIRLCTGGRGARQTEVAARVGPPTANAHHGPNGLFHLVATLQIVSASLRAERL